MAAVPPSKPARQREITGTPDLHDYEAVGYEKFDEASERKDANVLQGPTDAFLSTVYSKRVPYPEVCVTDVRQREGLPPEDE